VSPSTESIPRFAGICYSLLSEAFNDDVSLLIGDVLEVLHRDGICYVQLIRLYGGDSS
jgi:hypothetical protein